MSRSLYTLVGQLAFRLSDLEDFLATEKASVQDSKIRLAIDRLDEAIDDAEQAQNDAEDEEEEEEDE